MMIERNHIKKVILVCLTIGLPLFSSAQSVDDLIKNYFIEVRSGSFPSIPKQLFFSENSKDVLTALSPYFQDTIANVRSKAYTIVHLAGVNARQITTRQNAVYQLIMACKDTDKGITGLVLNYLTIYKKEDFAASSKDSLRSFFKYKISHLDQLTKLIGYLGLTDLTEVIRPYTQPGNPQSIRWAAIVSLARMKDVAASEEMMRRVKKLPVNDDVIYKLFPDLVYSRNPEAINYMIENMKSDEKKCLSADAEREQPIPCGYRIMEQLAPVVENYPLTLDNSGDIKTTDYVTALKTVRDWFAKHPDFKIREDNF